MKRTFKRLLSSALAACLTLGLALPASASEAEQFTVDGITYEVRNSSEVWVVNPTPGQRATGLSEVVTIPEKISNSATTDSNADATDTDADANTDADADAGTEYTVTGIGESAFFGWSDMTALTLPETITTIEIGAFGECTSLETLEIPAGVTTGVRELLTGKSGTILNASYAMPHAEKVTFAEGSPYSIEDGILYNGTVLEHRLDLTQTEVTVRAGTTEISDGAFLTAVAGAEPFSVTIEGDSITEIGAGVFQRSQLKSITLPESVTKIGEGAFYNCPNLTEIDLSNVTEISDGAFGTCENLADVTWPENLQSLGTMAFDSCASLNSVDIKGDITEIPDVAFMGCASVKNISLPEGLTSIGMGAFALGEESELESINIPSTVTSLGAMFLMGVKSDGTTVIDSALADPSVFAAMGEMEGEQVPVLGGLGESKVVFKVPANAGNAYKEALNDTLGGEDENTGIKIEESAPIRVTSITVNPAEDHNLIVGGTRQLAVTVSPANATDKSVTWSSSAPSVATVDENGLVTAAAAGDAIITATANGGSGVTGTCTVTVDTSTVAVSGVSVNPAALSVTVGNTGTLTANVTPEDATDKTVTWTTSNANVATVENGVVRAVGAGTATITATAGGYSATCTVYVTVPSTGGSTGTGGGSSSGGGSYWGGGSSSGGGSSYRPSRPTQPEEELKDPDVPLAEPLPFADVAESSWYYEAVRFVYDKGMMVGTGEGNFSPSVTTSRAMIASILWRLKGEPEAKAAQPFSDVADGRWYTKAVAWAAEEGVFKGYEGGKFSPNGAITREQLAAILWRYAGKPSASELMLSFADADKVSSYAQDAMRWAVDQKIITGKGGNILDPGGKTTRAEAAQMLMKFCELQEQNAG